MGHVTAKAPWTVPMMQRGSLIRRVRIVAAIAGIGGVTAFTQVGQSRPPCNHVPRAAYVGSGISGAAAGRNRRLCAISRARGVSVGA